MITYLKDCVARLNVKLEHSREQIAETRVETFGKTPDAFANGFEKTINVVALERVSAGGDVETES